MLSGWLIRVPHFERMAQIFMCVGPFYQPKHPTLLEYFEALVVIVFCVVHTHIKRPSVTTFGHTAKIKFGNTN